MSQPAWQQVASIGDKNIIDEGGMLVFIDQTGVYDPEAEVIKKLGESHWITYRFILEPCTFVDGILSDNPFHPYLPAWFASDLEEISEHLDRDSEDVINILCSDDVLARAEVWAGIGEYCGWENLDEEPREYKKYEDVELWHIKMTGCKP
jgi:hypothetical protein